MYGLFIRVQPVRQKSNKFFVVSFFIWFKHNSLLVRIKDRNKIRELSNPAATSKCQPQSFQGPAIIQTLPASFSQSSSCGICSGKYDSGTNLSLSSSFLPCHLSRHNWYISNYVSSGVWIIDPFEKCSSLNNIFNHVNITLITLNVLTSN